MKFLSKTFKVLQSLYKSYFLHLTHINLEWNHISIPESQLNLVLNQNLVTYCDFFLPEVTKIDWKTKSLPLLNSALRIDFGIQLTLVESFLYFCFPDWFERKKRKSVHQTLLPFLNDLSQTAVPTTSSNKFPIVFWKKPKNIVIESTEYFQFRAKARGDLTTNHSSHLLLYFDGKVDCFIKIYRLRHIKYLFHTKTFLDQAPIVGELYLKVRDTHNDKTFGNVYYAFQGRFLENQNDNFLLGYWNLHPLDKDAQLDLIPQEIIRSVKEHPPQKSKNITSIEPDIFSLEIVKKLINSDGQEATSSLGHPK